MKTINSVSSHQFSAALFFNILINSSTSIVILWSSSSGGFVNAATLRVFIAAFICLIVIAVFKFKLNIKENYKIYFSGQIGFTAGILLVYLSSGFIPSGLMAIMIITAPIISFFLEYFYKHIGMLSKNKIIGLIFTGLGLGLIFINKGLLTDYPEYYYGILLFFTSNVLSSVSNMLVKHYSKNSNNSVTAMAQNSGVILFSVPLYLTVWLIFGDLNFGNPSISFIGMCAYMALFVSFFGKSLMYWIIRHTSVTNFGLSCLPVPILSVVIGCLLNNERLDVIQWIGVFIAALGNMFFILKQNTLFNGAKKLLTSYK